MNINEARGPLLNTPKPRPAAGAPTAAGPAQPRDGLTLSGARPAAEVQGPGRADLDLSDASERIIAKAGGDLEAAYARSINLRNKSPKDADYQQQLTQFSLDAGLKRPITKDELRDMEHYLFAAAFTAGFAPGKPDDGYMDRVLNTLQREVGFASSVVATVGYSAAKVANEASKALFDKPLMKSRTKPSLDELIAGIKGAARGLTD